MGQNSLYLITDPHCTACTVQGGGVFKVQRGGVHKVQGPEKINHHKILQAIIFENFFIPDESQFSKDIFAKTFFS